MRDPADQPATPATGDPPIIGLAGAIGAGKSSLAAAFAGLGCLVIDSDREARAKLDEPAVRNQLIAWWGPSILGTDGRTDRRAVADRIFNDEGDRQRLEGLIHPLIRRTRQQAIDEGRASGSRAVIYDAPLLFEAGLDDRCDATVFIDALRERRLARLAATRGWDAAELDRREARQWPIDRKRSACRFIVDNDGPIEALHEAARMILAALGV